MSELRNQYLQFLQMAKDRRKNSFTQKEIAELLNITMIRIHNLESQKVIDYELLEIYCAILGINIKLSQFEYSKTF